MGYSSGHSKREDTRPLKEGLWKKEKAQMVVDFVKSHNWPIDRNIDVRLLCHCPPNSEVMFLLQFLINMVDPDFRLDSLDGDAVTNVFKKVLKYPYAIPVAKKVVQITPLTWPSVFGAVVWLVEKLQQDEHRLLHAGSPIPGIDNAAEFYGWVSSMYQKALWGQDEWRLAELELRQNMEAQVRELNRDNVRLESERENSKSALQALIERPDDLKKAYKQREEWSQDVHNFTIFVEKMKEYNESKRVDLETAERYTAELERHDRRAQRSRPRPCNGRERQGTQPV